MSDSGLFCAAGNFHIDPWRPVEAAVVTHAHADHLRWGSRQYLIAEPGLTVFRKRVGAMPVETLPYGKTVTRNGVSVTLFPAGHLLGSAQVRVEYRGEIWVASGDYKVQADVTCAPFEAVRCHTFITESTFGLPIYRWDEPAVIFDQINRWWRQNRDAGRASVLYAYALGKAQRVLAGVDSSIGSIYCHGAVEELNEAYRAAGVALPATARAEAEKGKSWGGSLIVAPPSAQGSPWLRKFQPVSQANASGWMAIRGTRRRKALDRGFALSDHADWPGLLGAIAATGAGRVLATHGYTAALARYLADKGLEAGALETRFAGEAEDLNAAVDAPAATFAGIFQTATDASGSDVSKMECDIPRG